MTTKPFEELTEDELNTYIASRDFLKACRNHVLIENRVQILKDRESLSESDPQVALLLADYAETDKEIWRIALRIA